MSEKTTTPTPLALAPWEDERTQAVYRILCSDQYPLLSAEHWEGWVARRIVAELFPAGDDAD